MQNIGLCMQVTVHAGLIPQQETHRSFRCPFGLARWCWAVQFSRGQCGPTPGSRCLAPRHTGTGRSWDRTWREGQTANTEFGGLSLPLAVWAGENLASRATWQSQSYPIHNKAWHLSEEGCRTNCSWGRASMQFECSAHWPPQRTKITAAETKDRGSG